MSARPSAIGALRTPAFVLVWSAGVVSGFGDKITLIALAYASRSLTQSAFVTSLSVVIATIPNGFFGLLGGALADAFGRRRAMIACDTLRVVLVGAIPASFALGLPLAFVYLLVFLASICGAVFRPARLSMLPDVLGGRDLGAGNSLIVSSDRLVEIVGALIAGALIAGAIVAAIGVGAFYIDALTFVISAVLLSRVDLREAPPRPAGCRSRAWRAMRWTESERSAPSAFSVRTRSSRLWRSCRSRCSMRSPRCSCSVRSVAVRPSSRWWRPRSPWVRSSRPG